MFGLHAGLAGSAWGTVAAQVIAAAAYARASRRSALPPARPTRAELRALLRDGHRLSVRTIALGVVPLAVTAVAARLGPVPLAGQQIAYRVWYLLSLSLDALAVPAQVYVSAALGTGDREAARLAARRTLVLGLAAGVALAVVTAALAFGAPQAFTADPAVRHDAVIALLCAALTQPLAALAFVYDGDHPRPRRLHRDAPGDGHLDLRLRAARAAGAPLPLARPAVRVGGARLLDGGPHGAARPALGAGDRRSSRRSASGGRAQP